MLGGLFITRWEHKEKCEPVLGLDEFNVFICPPDQLSVGAQVVVRLDRLALDKRAHGHRNGPPEKEILGIVDIGGIHSHFFGSQDHNSLLLSIIQFFH